MLQYTIIFKITFFQKLHTYLIYTTHKRHKKIKYDQQLLFNLSFCTTLWYYNFKLLRALDTNYFLQIQCLCVFRQILRDNYSLQQ